LGYTQKKSVELFVFAGSPEVLDYLFPQLQRIISRLRGNAVATSGEIFWKCPSFRRTRLLFRFFLFYVVHIKLCAMFHWQLFLLWLVVSIFGCKDTYFILNVWCWNIFCLRQMLYCWYPVRKKVYILVISM